MTETTDRSHWFPPEPESIRAARRFTEEALGSKVTPACLEVARLVVSELVTNSVRHAQGRFVVQVEYDDAVGNLRIEVVDRGPGEPVLRDPAPDEEGRGLRIVDRVASDWGWAQRPDGKVVWCHLDCHRLAVVPPGSAR